MNKILKSFLLGCACLTATASTFATTLTSKTNIDNGYEIYISTSDNVQGAQFGAANNWYSTYTDTTTLAAGTDYYLHVHAYDQGWIAGFLGDFSLTGTDHKFVNGGTSLVTNTTDWQGNTSGWGAPYIALTDLGPNGSWPWYYQGAVSGAANWIWAGDAYDNDGAWFSTKISATTDVPEPVSIALLGLGLAGLGFGRRRKQA